MEERLDKQQLAEAKRQARRFRIRTIRRRVATGAVVLVALFSGLTLYRSIETTATQTSPATTSSDDEGSISEAALSLFQESDDEGDDGESSGFSVTTSPSPSPSSAPLTSSQS